MNTRISTLFGNLALMVGVIALAAACGGGGDDGDTGPKFDIPGKPDVIYTDDGKDTAEMPGDTGAGEDLMPADNGKVDTTPPEKCEKDEHCIGKVTLGPCQDPSCNTTTGECGWKWKACCDQVFINEGFENGMPEGWTVEDNKDDDFVTWDVTDNRHAFGTHSVYAGHPKCHTYYNGPLDQDCKKDGGSGTVVRLGLLTPEIEFPDTGGTLVAEFYAWMDTEPMIGGVEPNKQPDRLTVQAVVGSESVDLFPLTKVQKTTDGVFMFVTTSLKGLSGKKVKLRFKFDTLDSNNNEFEGVYVDNVRIFSSCALVDCNLGENCASDEEECTNDECSVYWDNDHGYCGYPEVPTCIEPMCTTENVATKCLDAKECEEPACVDGACVYNDVPNCCKTHLKLDADFDDGSLDGFSVYSFQSNAKVKWQVSNQRSVSPEYSLYYGDTVSHTYESTGAFNFGEATSQVVMLEEGNAFLTFNLFLATEFDNTDPDKYYNPLGIDFFEVQVIENVGSVEPEVVTQVWSGHNIQGTTGGLFIPVGVDLTPWAGKNIWLRFRFDTSDNVDNGHEGAYVDDVKIEYSTPTCGDEYVGRNCQGDYDCGIDGVCKTGACVDNKCDVQVVGTPPDCCSTQTDCEDGDPCTADGCIDHKCVYSPIEGPGCCTPETLADWNFDLGALSGFSVVDDGSDVKWQNTAAQSKSPPNALYFGDGVDYDNGAVVSGSALSPSVSVPIGGDFGLSFSLFLDVDSNEIFDLFKVEVVADDMTPTLVYSKASVPLEAYQKWFEVSNISLNAYKGKDVKVRFSFDSIDQINNGGFGIAIDDVKITKTCL